MKKNIYILIACLSSLHSFSQFKIKDIDATLSKINDHLYASKFEVSNKLYEEFLRALKSSNRMDALAIAQIDTLKWMDPSSKNEPYVHYYHSHIAYQDFPVFNISYEGAQLYCQWLTDNYNQNTNRKFKKVIFKLPTEQEWIQAAQGGDLTARYPWKGNELYSKEKLAKCNFTRDARDTAWVKGPVLGNKDVMTNVKAYWPNAFGLYNMSGNAAEMIDVKGVTKGGGWRTTSEYTDITSKYSYEGNAEQFVGFRYFMQVLEF